MRTVFYIYILEEKKRKQHVNNILVYLHNFINNIEIDFDRGNV